MTWLQENKEAEWELFLADLCKATDLNNKAATATVLLTKEEFITTMKTGFNAGFNRGVRCEKSRGERIRKSKYGVVR